MSEQFVRHLGATAAQMPDSMVEIDGVPERDGCGEQRQAEGTMVLVLESAVAQFNIPRRLTILWYFEASDRRYGVPDPMVWRPV